MAVVLDPVELLHKDIRQAIGTLTPRQVRYLVDSYYQHQENRKSALNQIRALLQDTACQMRDSGQTEQQALLALQGRVEQGYELGMTWREVNDAVQTVFKKKPEEDRPQGPGEEPHAVLLWLAAQETRVEDGLRKALGDYSQSTIVGRWAESIVGIGPVISAGLLAHIDIRRAPTAGHIWNFAGLNPGVEWLEGEKRPWNARLKTLCWKIAESFVKTSNHPKSYYGPLYKQRKALEQGRNERGELADQAAEALRTKNYGRDTEARKWYEQGKLPPSHIHARAERWTVKLFLSHWHHVAFVTAFGVEPPVPYALAHLPGHQDYLAPPNWPIG